MPAVDSPSISIKEQFRVEARPDVALIKLFVVGEGMVMVDAVGNVRNKVAEISDTFKSAHPLIERIEAFDVYLGQKEERLRNEPTAFPRPLAVQGILITARPDDSAALHRIIDDGIKRGALLDTPHRRSYLNNYLDSALIFGLIASERHEGHAVEQCLRRAEARGRATAAAAGKRLGKLIELADVLVESVGDPFHREFAHIKRSFPTRFLSPTPEKVIISASLTARYELLENAG